MTGTIGHSRMPTDPSPASPNGSSRIEEDETIAEPGRHRRVGPLWTSLRLAAIFLAVVAVGAAAGYYGSMLLPKQYAARAEIQYKLSKSMPNELLREDRTLTTQKVLLDSMTVLRPVAVENHIAPEDLVKDITVDVVENSEVITVELRSDTRERAQRLLTGVLKGYLVEANKDWRDPVRAYVESRVADVQAKLQEVQADMLPELSPESAAELSGREHVLNDLLGYYQGQLSSTPDPLTDPPARVLITPYQVTEQVRPRMLLNAAAGAAAAFVVAALVVLVVARRRIRS